MKAKAKAVASFLKRHRYVTIALLVLVAIAAVWVLPFRTTLTYLRFEMPGVIEQTPVTFEVYSDAPYYEMYDVEVPVENGRVEIHMAKNYLPLERIVITDPAAAQVVMRMDVRQSLLKKSDHICASLDHDVVVQAEDGEWVLSAIALETVERGATDTQMVRLLFTLLVLGIGGLVALFTAVHNRFGNIKAIFIVGAVVGCAFMLIKAIDHLTFLIPISRFHIPAVVPILAIMVVVLLLIAVCLFVPAKSVWAKRLIVAVYVFALVFSAAKMLFYSERVGRTPDEAAHIAYIAQLHQSGDLIPHYEDLHLAAVTQSTGHVWHFSLPQNSTNYLGHPPLYYLLMRLVGGISFTSDTTFVANVFLLRMFSIAMTLVGLALMLYFGYSRIKSSPLVHLLYASICISVPMFAYGASGVNNDALTYITIPLFFWGVLRYLENKRNVWTYLLIAVGISATVLTKLTAGVIVAVAAVIVLAVTLIREKNWRELLKPAFLCTLVVYAVPVVYYLLVYARYGHFRPTFFELNPEFAYSSVFYVDPASRRGYSLMMYVAYFVTQFMRCWTGISSHVSMLKPSTYWGSVQNIALVLVWFVPFLFTKRTLRKQSAYSLGMVACCAGVAVALILQFFNGYDGFLSRGYLGGFQSRYYLCIVFVFAFCMAVAMQKLFDYLDSDGRHSMWLRQSIECVTAIYIGLLYYEDFLYFLLNFRDYWIG